MLRPSNAYYLTNPAGQPTTWVIYAGPALRPAEVRVRVKDEGNVISVNRNRLQEIPGYQQVDPMVYFAQGGLPEPPPAPAGGWANVDIGADMNMDGGRRRRSTRRRSTRRNRTTRRHRNNRR